MVDHSRMVGKVFVTQPRLENKRIPQNQTAVYRSECTPSLRISYFGIYGPTARSSHDFYTVLSLLSLRL
jgi:hypothetical protein